MKRRASLWLYLCIALVVAWGCGDAADGDGISGQLGPPGTAGSTTTGGEDMSLRIDGEFFSWPQGPGELNVLLGNGNTTYSIGHRISARGRLDLQVKNVQSTPSTHACDAMRTATLQVDWDGVEYDSISDATCTIEVTAATGENGRFEGSFSGTLTAEGAAQLMVTDGRFGLDVGSVFGSN